MAQKKLAKRAPGPQRETTSQTKPALELYDIDRLSRIELRLRYVTDILAESMPDIYTFLRPVWDDLEQFQERLVERWNESTVGKVEKKRAATMSEGSDPVNR
jgi:hypothetical protein